MCGPPSWSRADLLCPRIFAGPTNSIREHAMGTDIFRRPYRDETDYLRMRRFLQDGWRETGVNGGLFHVGDLTWHRFMFTRDVQPPEELFALWETPGGKLVGFCEYYAKYREASLQIDPSL